MGTIMGKGIDISFECLPILPIQAKDHHGIPFITDNFWEHW